MLFIAANVVVSLIAFATVLKLIQGTLFASAPAAAPAHAAHAASAPQP